MPGRVLLANEAGNGRGHVTTLKVFAEAMGPDCIYDAALCSLEHATEIAPLCDRVFQGASLAYQPDVVARRAGRPIGNWAEYLAAIGFADEAFLVRQIAWWIEAIRARHAGLVVAEFAPCAMLAARALGVPVISIGQGHSTPPAGMEHFPLPAGGRDALVHDEAELVDIVNRAGARFGLPALRHFSDVYCCAAQLPRTIAALDPYAGWRREPTYLPPLGLDCPEAAAGDEVFVYFSTMEGEDEAIVEALAMVDLPMRVVMSSMAPDLAQRLVARGVAVERQPLTHADIARRGRIFVHAGQHGATSLALALGMPQVALPCQSEQQANAARVVAMGSAVGFPQPRSNPGAIATAIERVYRDPAMTARAAALARALRRELVGDTSAIVRSMTRSVLERAAAG